MTNDTLSAAAIRDLTPTQAWEAFVGEQTPVDFVKVGGNTADYVENAPLCEGLTIAAQSILRIRLDDYITAALRDHAVKHPAPRMTETDALALHPDASARNIRAMIAGDDDASCPACGARLCWGDRRNTGNERFDIASAYCVRGGNANLGLMACDWRGTVRIYPGANGDTAVVAS